MAITFCYKKMSLRAVLDCRGNLAETDCSGIVTFRLEQSLHEIASVVTLLAKTLKDSARHVWPLVIRRVSFDLETVLNDGFQYLHHTLNARRAYLLRYSFSRYILCPSSLINRNHSTTGGRYMCIFLGKLIHKFPYLCISNLCGFLSVIFTTTVFDTDYHYATVTAPQTSSCLPMLHRNRRQAWALILIKPRSSQKEKRTDCAQYNLPQIWQPPFQLYP